MTRLTLFIMIMMEVANVTAQTCSSCFGGATPTNPGGTSAVGGINCTTLINLGQGATEGSRGCESNQMALFQGCGCPEYNNDVFCAMCPDDFYDLDSNQRNRDVPLFTSENVKCGDLLFPRWSSGRCEDAQRSAFYCGCPNAPLPVCAFCPDDLSPEYEDILLPPFYNQTCADIRDVAPFYITNETCAAFLDDFPVQPECLCDCGAVDPIPEEENCRLCGNETVSFPSMMVQIDEANVLVSLSCAEVGRLAQCAKEANFCADLVENFYSPCCLGIPNTPSPTQSPGDQVSPMPTSTPATSDDSLGRWQVSWLCPLLLTMLIWNVL